MITIGAGVVLFGVLRAITKGFAVRLLAEQHGAPSATAGSAS